VNSKNHQILRVKRSKTQARKLYDSISRFYDCFTIFESKYRDRTLILLDIKPGEYVLEIGFGTGHCLKKIAEIVGKSGKVYGIDISPKMLEISKRRLEKHGLMDRVELYCGDALEMSYENNKFDAVFMSFTLELFDTPEIPRLLAEVRRVLKPNGRLGVVSMSREGNSILLKLYEWLHERFPQYLDCRPIYVERSVREAGFKIKYTERVRLLGLPGEIVIGVRN
jgi:demethylmenaquinone methyltransferase/2-methoxy-6-polyprenyl-1,4-benzoquinol methylase